MCTVALLASVVRCVTLDCVCVCVCLCVCLCVCVCVCVCLCVCLCLSVCVSLCLCALINLHTLICMLNLYITIWPHMYIHTLYTLHVNE